MSKSKKNKSDFLPTGAHPLPGLETEMPNGMIPTARTVAALYVLERKSPVVYMQFDDGPEDVETAAQLEQIAGEVGYSFLWEREPHSAFLISSDVLEI